MLDVAIVGAGPAGLTAAIYTARAGLSTMVFEPLLVGGQLTSIDELENYPGFPEGVNGFDMAMRMKEQAERFGAALATEEVTGISGQPSSGYVVETTSGRHDARTVILATGAKPRKLDVPGVLGLEGKGVSYCATCDGNLFRGQDVVVNGGGDTACADALYLANVCTTVHLVHRRDEFRAHQAYVDRIMRAENVKVHWHSVVSGVEETDGRLSGVQVRNVITDETSTIPAAALFVAIGSVPKTDWLADVVERDEAGYVQAGHDCHTSAPGIFVAGDVRTTLLRQVVTAAADGALAGEAAVAYLSGVEETQ